ncbi:helix-turn-helix domain-containing protein, partial [Pseudoalteromonas peptidolytica]
ILTSFNVAPAWVGGYFMTETIFKLPSVFEVRYIDRAAGCERAHTHSSLIFSAISRGEMLFQMNENEFTLQPPSIVAVSPNTLHCVRSYSPDFKGVFTLEVFDSSRILGDINSRNCQSFKSQVLESPDLYDRFTTLCTVLLSEVKSSEKENLILNWINNFLDHQKIPHTESCPTGHELAKKIKAMIDCHHQETSLFDEISLTLNLSKEHCNRIFRRTYNLSIQGYFLNKKAHLSRSLLVGDLPISEIAVLSGFYDQSHFSRIFKAIFQISPAEYRMRIKESHQSCTRRR